MSFSAFFPGMQPLPTGGGSGGNAILSLRRATRAGEETRATERLANDPQIQRSMEQFKRAVDRAPDARAALRDPRVMTVIATALGMPDAANQAGLAQRALLSNPKDQESIVNRLSDRRWKSAAETLNLGERGIAALRDPAIQARLAEGLTRARWRENLEAEAAGLGDAVLFRERAATARTAFDVLGDPILRRVVTTAVGLPQQIAVQSVEAQGRALTARLDITKLQDPREVNRLAERYLMNRTSTPTTAPMLFGVNRLI